VSSGGPLVFQGQLLTPTGLAPGTLVVEGERIAEVRVGDVTPVPGAFRADLIAPGFVELQLNGAFGQEADGGAEALRALCERLPSTGTTSFLPTVISSSAAKYDEVFRAFEAARSSAGAQMPGLHLEGPYLSSARAGAHPLASVSAATAVPFEALLEPGYLRLMTLAPELPGTLERIRRLRGAGVLVSLGHSEATATQVSAAVGAGARMVTHLFNAMSGFGHRAPGMVGAALVEDRLTVGLIADGIHCHPMALQLAFRAKSPQRVVLVTDAMAAAGMPPGPYSLGGQAVVVDGTSARLENGTLAGSTLTLDAAVRNTVTLAGVSMPDALRSASEIPARLLGLERKGTLTPGMDADLVLLSLRLDVQSTWVLGRRVYEATAP
jgi:N-acetylglucosamine-6-phosphate deacetylase